MKNFKIAFALCWALGCAESFAQEVPKPEKLKLFKFDALQIKLPQDFIPMEDEAFFMRYATSVKATVAMRSPDERVEFTANNTINAWGNNLTLLKDFNKATIQKVHKKVTFISEDIVTINKRDFIVLEFESVIDDEITPAGEHRTLKQYHYIMYTVKDGYVTTISMKMPHWMKEKWREATQKIMSSIIIK